MLTAEVPVPVANSTLLCLSNSKKWLVTCSATAISTYALDAVATVAGLLFVASGLPNNLNYASALVLLGASYLIWGAGVAVTLRANWDLLEATGASTNAPSKALYDLAKSRTGNAGIRKLAAATGYVGTEIAKEAPYYAGAFGAVLLTDSITAIEALIFLGGANLGAAAYEYGLAVLTRAMLFRAPDARTAAGTLSWRRPDAAPRFSRCRKGVRDSFGGLSVFEPR
jgi:hypothetical protein